MPTIIERAQLARTEALRVRGSAWEHKARARQLRETSRRGHRAAILGIWNARRLCYDFAGPVLAMWSDGASRTEGIEDLIYCLFGVGMTLASCRALASERLDDQLIDATDQLDGLIRDLRLFAFHDAGHPSPHFIGDGSRINDITELLDRLGVTADLLNLLAEEHALDRSIAPRLDDATQNLRTAWVKVQVGLG